MGLAGVEAGGGPGAGVGVEAGRGAVPGGGGEGDGGGEDGVGDARIRQLSDVYRTPGTKRGKRLQ